MDEYLCVNTCNSCYDNLIREKGADIEKENNL